MKNYSVWIRQTNVVQVVIRARNRKEAKKVAGELDMRELDYDSEDNKVTCVEEDPFASSPDFVVRRGKAVEYES
jgi:hypothetical protein